MGQTACNGSNDGACDTNNIYVYYQNFANGAPIPLSFYAAGLCKQPISGLSGWYLPAICEMGYGPLFGCGVVGSPTLQNMQSNIVTYNGLNLISGDFWSATQRGDTEQALYAAAQTFPSTAQTIQAKDEPLAVRCSRTF
jgi:hypothetical protein